MPTYDFTTGGPDGIHNRDLGRKFATKVDLKASEIIASDTTLTANGVIAANDIIQAYQVPALCIVEQVVANVVTAEGGVATVDIGLNGGTEFHAALDINATGYTQGTIADQLFSAGDTIDVQFLAETDTAEIELFIVGTMLEL